MHLYLASLINTEKFGPKRKCEIIMAPCLVRSTRTKEDIRSYYLQDAMHMVGSE
jgi:hypothetical protein